MGGRILAGYKSSGRANVTGTRNRLPEETRTKAIRAYRPFERLWLVFNRNELDSLLNAQKIGTLADEMHFKLITYELTLRENGKPSATDIPATLQAMKEAEVDFVYVGSSSFLMANKERFTSDALALGLPVATAYEAIVTEAHALFAVASRYYNVGRLAVYPPLSVLGYVEVVNGTPASHP